MPPPKREVRLHPGVCAETGRFRIGPRRRCAELGRCCEEIWTVAEVPGGRAWRAHCLVRLRQLNSKNARPAGHCQRRRRRRQASYRFRRAARKHLARHLPRHPLIGRRAPELDEIACIVEHEIAVIGVDDEHGMKLARDAMRAVAKRSDSDRPAARDELATLGERIILAIARTLRVLPILGLVIKGQIRPRADGMIECVVHFVELAPARLAESGWCAAVPGRPGARAVLAGAQPLSARAEIDQPRGCLDGIAERQGSTCGRRARAGRQ